MKTKQDIINEFEEKFNTKYYETWEQALKSDTRVELFFYLSKDKEIVVRNNRPREYAPFLHMYFEPADFKREKLTLNELVVHLTNEDKTCYIQAQNRFLENDDYLFYDVNDYMINWIKNCAPYATKAYLKSKITERKNSFVKYTWKGIIDNLINAIDNLNPLLDVLKKIKLELKELNDKIVKLSYFIESNSTFTTLSSEEQSAMKKQLKAMTSYETALRTRINLIEQRIGEKNEKSN